LRRRLIMRVPLDVPPADPTYVHLDTMSRHIVAETKMTQESL